MAGKKKILIVEDNSDIRKLMVFFLERMGYDVLEAATGLAAIERASATLPDLITMDLGLPDIQEIRQRPALKLIRPRSISQ
jgi:CheY-like chemotaxis protein